MKTKTPKKKKKKKKGQVLNSFLSNRSSNHSFPLISENVW